MFFLYVLARKGQREGKFTFRAAAEQVVQRLVEPGNQRVSRLQRSQACDELEFLGWRLLGADLADTPEVIQQILGVGGEVDLERVGAGHADAAFSPSVEGEFDVGQLAGDPADDLAVLFDAIPADVLAAGDRAALVTWLSEHGRSGDLSDALGVDGSYGEAETEPWIDETGIDQQVAHSVAEGEDPLVDRDDEYGGRRAVRLLDGGGGELFEYG
nr:hypothetical protein [Nonomuraea ceibae]